MMLPEDATAIHESELRRLNPWAIQGRYADAIPEAARELAHELLEVAERVIAHANERLAREPSSGQ